MRFAANPPASALRGHRTGILVNFLGVIVVASSLAGAYGFSLGHKHTSSSSPPWNYPVTAELSVKVYDSSGALKASVTQNDDMVMNNFMNFLASWLTNEGYTSAPSTFTMTDTADGRHPERQGLVWLVQRLHMGLRAPQHPAVRRGLHLGRDGHDCRRKNGPQADDPVSVPRHGDPADLRPVDGQHRLRGRDPRRVRREHIRGRVLRELVHRHRILGQLPDVPRHLHGRPGLGREHHLQSSTRSSWSTAYNNNLGTLLVVIFTTRLAQCHPSCSRPQVAPRSLSSSTSSHTLPTTEARTTTTVRPRGGPRLRYHWSDSAIRVGTGTASTCPSNPGGFAVPERRQPLPAGPDLHRRGTASSSRPTCP